MELFSIKRYDESKEENNPEEEDAILQKLLRKVEKRKRLLEQEKLLKQENNLESPETLEENNEETKKPRIETEILENVLQNDDEEMDKPEDRNVESTEPPKEEQQEFQVLGEDKMKKKQRIDMILPSWLAYPSIVPNVITEEESENVDDINYLSDQIKENLKSMNYKTMFPVQKIIIPWIIEAHSKPFPFRPRDVCVSAPTGSGKTLAFAVPVIQILQNRVERKIRALVVLPVNELATQVYIIFKKLCEKTDLVVQLLTKSCSFAHEQQLLAENYNGVFYSKTDIVVTTPGRLVEHLKGTKGLCFKSLKFLIIDEADRIMEQAHHYWLYHLEEHMKIKSNTALSAGTIPLCMKDLQEYACRQPHKLLYSATLSSDPEKLQGLRLFQPKLFTSVVKTRDELMNDLIQNQNNPFRKENQFEDEIRGEFVGKYTTPAELTEKYCLTQSIVKPLTLSTLITKNNWTRFLCFTNSAETAHRLAFVLQKLLPNTVKIEELSSSLKPQVRRTILYSFIEGAVNGLICSDALTRGIDIPEVDIVISYDAPRHIKTYIHRIGRTARAGRLGTAITLLTEQEKRTFNKIISQAGKESVEEIKVDTEIEEEGAKSFEMAIKQLKRAIENEQKYKEIKDKILKSKAESRPSGDDILHAEALQSQLISGITLKMNDKEQEKVDNKTSLKSWLASSHLSQPPRKLRKNINKKTAKAKKREKQHPVELEENEN